MTQELIKLRISRLICDEVSQRGLASYGSAYEKINDAWEQAEHRKSALRIAFTPEEVEDLRNECMLSMDSDWDSEIVTPWRNLARQIDKAVSA